MSVVEIMPALRELNRGDKWRVMKFLLSELAEEESLLKTNVAYPVWSPYNSFEAANELLRILKEEAAHE